MSDEIIERINKLRKERNAIIIAHNYQRGEVQDIADFVGDSLELSQKAAKIDADVIVFCGVHFMAETASILSPDKTVLIPDKDSGCPMADMIDADALRKLKSEHPTAKVVCYVNSSAEVKAESDICCTSSNATRIVASFPVDQEIIFIPDQYLGHYAASQSGREVILWHGYCPTHAKIIPPDIEQLRQDHPNAKVVVHPECRPDVIALADEVASTSGILKYCQREDIHEVIVGTEMGIIHRLEKENPGKQFFPISKKAVCPNMKRITLEKVQYALEEMTPEVKVPENIRLKAKAAVDRMLEA
ncbi:MAG: quinolinate synthase NadA [Chloroflexi bacterium]|jgi:quinolinate synthase|nr:quinolinate synthase NadA [Chloroflexota bacterium]